MKYFTLLEFACMETLNNERTYTLTEKQIKNIQILVANVLDPIREQLGIPITVTSGARTSSHNKSVGGVWNSQHLTGQAADITCSNVPKLFQLLYDRGAFDQLIYYRLRNFIHVSFVNTVENRKQVIMR